MNVFQNKVLRKIFGPNRKEEYTEKSIMKSVVVNSLRQFLLK
jgi:hypothetical protein